MDAGLKEKIINLKLLIKDILLYNNNNDNNIDVFMC